MILNLGALYEIWGVMVNFCRSLLEYYVFRKEEAQA